MNKMWIVTKQTFKHQVRSLSFLMLILGPILMLLITAGVSYFAGTNSQAGNKIAIVTNQPMLFTKEDGLTLKYHTIKSAKKAVKSEEIDGYVVIKISDDIVNARYYSDDYLDNQTKSKLFKKISQIQSILNIQNAQLTTKQITDLQRQPILKQNVKKSNQNSKYIKIIDFYILMFMMYVILLFYSSTTAQEIATEKGTKIMEVIFSSIDSKKYFFGKIIGIFGVILLHTLIYAVLGGLSLIYIKLFGDNMSFIQNNKKLIFDGVRNLLSFSLLYVILAVVLYTIFAALCGALVTKTEDTSKAVSPITSLIMLNFFVAMLLMNNTDGLIVKLLSYIPLTSSFFMPIRIINGTISLFEIIISLLILLSTIVLSLVYVSRIYFGLILQTDDIGMFNNLKRGLRMKQ